MLKGCIWSSSRANNQLIRNTGKEDQTKFRVAKKKSDPLFAAGQEFQKRMGDTPETNTVDQLYIN